ncbi:MAG: hypothetical protein ACI4UM_01955 [Succinivibrio sp.]
MPNLASYILCTFLLGAIALESASPVYADDKEILTDDLREYESLLSDDFGLNEIEQNSKDSSEKDDNKTPRQKVLESKARDHTDRAITFRNYVEPIDEDLLDQKQYYNEDYSRANGQALIERKQSKKEKQDNTNLEKGLMSSFEKKKAKKNKTVKTERKRDTEKSSKKKGDGNSAQYRNQAGSLSDAFKKK